MSCLFFAIMRRNDEGFIDRFVLSAGHCAVALFAVLLEVGLYTIDELETYGQDGSRIEESPLEGIPGFEITGGSLGQGLSQAVGMALGERIRGKDGRVFCLVSDGELQEGQVWEAAMSAGGLHVGNLVVLVDNNHVQADGVTDQVMTVEPVPEKFEAFGFRARRVSGNELAAMLDALQWACTPSSQPTAIVCETKLGFGVGAFESLHQVHYVRGTREFWNGALMTLE